MPIDMYSISHYLAQLLDIAAFDDVAPNGVQIEGHREVRRIASAVTASLYAIDEANRRGADLLLVHHGLFLINECQGLRGLVRQRVGHLVQSGIHLLAYHLPLDAHEEFGNTWPFARWLGMTDLRPFGSVHGKLIGVRGTLPQSITGKDLFSHLQKFWGVPGVYVGTDDHRPLATCAFVSGQGHRFLQEALDARVDCFINGTVDDRVWHMVQESQIQCMAFGHYATERSGVQLLGNHLADKYSLEHFFIEELNPF